MARNIVVLGSTGSIGRQTLDVARALGEDFRIYGLSAHRNIALLRRQIEEFKPVATVVSDDTRLADLGDQPQELLSGEEGAIELVVRPEVDLVVVGSSGKSGLAPTLAGLRAGKRIALANKEPLVMAGQIIRNALVDGGGELVPVDSEHSAIWQCLLGEPAKSVERLTLTASGGAFRDRSPVELERVTPEQALQHPTWSMGRKITVDSANLMNKGLEIIEAHWLFNVSYKRIDVVLHPQSIVHSMVTFEDSSSKAQLGVPDMRLPIQYALTHPQRCANSLQRLNLASLGNLTFGAVDLARYPALALAREAGVKGGTYPAVLCGADEVAVEAFLDGRIPFLRIPHLVEEVMGAHHPCWSPQLTDILEADRWARSYAVQLVRS